MTLILDGMDQSKTNIPATTIISKSTKSTHFFDTIYNIHCRSEREKYYTHREKSCREPQKYMILILDGMDQSKTNIPATTIISKSTQNLS